MMDILDIRTLVDLGVYILGMGITIAVVKTDVRWIKQWCREHKEEDEKRFDKVDRDIRDLRRIEQ